MQKYCKQNSISRQNNYIFDDLTYIKRSTKCSIKNVKLIYIILLFIIVLLFFNCFSNIAYAKTNNIDEEKLKLDLIKEIEEQLDKLELKDLEGFVSSVQNNIGNLFNLSVKDLMKKIINGEFIVDFDSFVNYVIFLSNNIFKKYLPIILFVVIISIMSGILNGLTSGFIKKQTTDLINLICYFAIIIVIFTPLGELIYDVKNTVFTIKKLMDISFPIILTLIVAMGGLVTSSMYKPIMLILSNVIVNVISSVIIPFFIASIILNVVGNMSSTVKLTKLPKFFTSISSWLLGMMFSLFSAFVSLKGISGVMVDNVSISATKFCLSSYVPILGGYVSDGFDLVLASCMLIKNSFGITVLVILLLVTLLPILKVLFFVLMLKLIEAVIEPISDNKICNLLHNISSSLVMLISSLVGLAFMFFILVFLIISTFSFNY